ncbi:MAG: PIG-L deacetylase family protein [Bryobacteraceae bacterium]
MTRILAIHAHPDDVEIFAGGTAALLVERGHHVTIVTMTPGDCGTTDYPPEEIAAIRRKEAADAARLIGAEYICAEFRDLAIFNDDASRRRVTEILRCTQPEIVLTSSPEDYHCDHEATSALVRDACFAAPAPNYDAGTASPIARIPHLYFVDPAEGRDRSGRPVLPDFVVNIESTFEKKKAMFACHQSQRDWLRTHHHMDDYLETMEQWTREQGRRANITYGEGFRPYHCHPYPQSPLLEELVGGAIPIPGGIAKP